MWASYSLLKGKLRLHSTQWNSVFLPCLGVGDFSCCSSWFSFIWMVACCSRSAEFGSTWRHSWHKTVSRCWWESKASCEVAWNPHWSHWKVWVLRCSVYFESPSNFKPHGRHFNNPSSWGCKVRWRSNKEADSHVYEHWSQDNTSPWVFSCSIKSLWEFVIWSHFLHRNSPISLWIFSWIVNWDLLVNRTSQCWHLNLLSSTSLLSISISGKFWMSVVPFSGRISIPCFSFLCSLHFSAVSNAVSQNRQVWIWAWILTWHISESSDNDMKSQLSHWNTRWTGEWPDDLRWLNKPPVYI